MNFHWHLAKKKKTRQFTFRNWKILSDINRMVLFELLFNISLSLFEVKENQFSYNSRWKLE